MINPDIHAIDLKLASPSDRYMMMPGDVDRLLDARLVLMKTAE